MIGDRLGVAIHGAGRVARAHVASWLKNPHVKIVRVGSRNKASAQRLADQFGLDCAVGDDFRELLDDDRVDIFNLSGPNHVHAEQGIAAARAGKHLLVEKPMCVSMAENRALSDAVAKAGVKSIICFVLRWNPLFENLKTLLGGGAIGKTSVLLDAEIPYQFNIDLLGSEGTLRDNRLWSKRLLPGQTGWTAMSTILPDSGAVEHHPFDAQINHFVDCIRENRESHCNVADAYHTHEVCMAIDRSMAAGGRPVKLPLED